MTFDLRQICHNTTQSRFLADNHNMDSQNHMSNGTGESGDWQKDVNQVLSTIAGSLSICGTILIFVTFILWREMRTTSRKILVFISIGDLLTAMVNISGVWMSSTGDLNNNNPLCKVQSFINIAAILSSFFWTVYLSVFLYLSLCGLRSESEKKVMFVFHVTAWGIPLIVAISAACVGDVLGRTTISDGWCWVSYDLSSHWLLFWMLFAGKGWEILAYLAITVFYIKAKVVLKQKVNTNTPRFYFYLSDVYLSNTLCIFSVWLLMNILQISSIIISFSHLSIHPIFHASIHFFSSVCF